MFYVNYYKILIENHDSQLIFCNNLFDNNLFCNKCLYLILWLKHHLLKS